MTMHATTALIQSDMTNDSHVGGQDKAKGMDKDNYTKG